MKVLALTASNAVGLPSLPAFWMHLSTSSIITIGTGLEDNPDVELAPAKFKNPPGYLFFMIVLAIFPTAALPTSPTLSFSEGQISTIGSNRSLANDCAKSKVGNITSMLLGLTSM